MTANIVAPNKSIFSSRPEPMWFVKIEKILAHRVKIKFLQKVLVSGKEENDKLTINIFPKEIEDKTTCSIKVTIHQYDNIVNNIDVKYYIGYTIKGHFIFVLSFPEYSSDILESDRIELVPK